jgi:LemA protein
MGLGLGAIALIIVGLIVVVLIAIALWGVGIYNKLVTLRNRFKNAWSQIDVQLQRRYDLIPNLVETAKGYMKHERETLEAVIQARNQASGLREALAANPGNLSAMKGLMGSEAALGGAMSRLMVVMEQYPDLKASTTMSQLMEELTSTENKVSFARQSYNDFAMAYNNAREVFPASFVANMTGFTEAALFGLESEEAKKAPKVAFS